MTSEQVRKIVTRASLLALVCVVLAGCGLARPVEKRIKAPYGERQVWAVAPLRNETGSRHPDGVKMADELSRTFEQVIGIDVTPVNRVLETMHALKMSEIATREDAIRLREELGVHALVVGTMTHYDAYEPLKFGLALDLYTWPAELSGRPLDIRELTWTPTSDGAGIRRSTLHRPDQPVTTVSGYFNAAGVGTKQLIEDYAYGKGTTPNGMHNTRLYTINMSLFQEFVSYEMSSQMIWAEWQRMARAIRRERVRNAAEQPAPE